MKILMSLLLLMGFTSASFAQSLVKQERNCSVQVDDVKYGLRNKKIHLTLERTTDLSENENAIKVRGMGFDLGFKRSADLQGKKLRLSGAEARKSANLNPILFRLSNAQFTVGHSYARGVGDYEGPTKILNMTGTSSVPSLSEIKFSCTVYRNELSFADLNEALVLFGFRAISCPLVSVPDSDVVEVN